MNTTINTTAINESQEMILNKLGSLGFLFNSKFEIVRNLETNIWIAKKTFKIDPTSLGLFAPAIKAMHVDVTAKFSEEGYRVIELNYQYQHPSGSNGYTVRLDNNSKTNNEWVDKSF